MLDTPSIGSVGPTGTVELPDRGLTVEWSVYTDQWRDLAAASTRQRAIDGMPVVETHTAVPSGDVVHRAFGAAGNPPALVIELENASPAPVAVALRLHGSESPAPHDLVGAAPMWREVERHGDVTSLVWPLPHRASVRASIALPPDARDRPDPRARPAAADVVRGWSAQLARGARFDVDDEVLQQAVDGARAALLLDAGRTRPRAGSDEAIGLEDWGFDAEALALWHRLSIRERRRASRRVRLDEPWSRVRAELAGAPGGVPARPAGFLRALRDVVVRETKRQHAVELFPGFPAEWLGRAVALHDFPTRDGLVSCALRWHGARPALLWSAPSGVVLTAPALDPAWSVAAGKSGDGEALLAPPSDQLLRLGTAPPGSDGDAIEDPGSFT